MQSLCLPFTLPVHFNHAAFSLQSLCLHMQVPSVLKNLPLGLISWRKLRTECRRWRISWGEATRHSTCNTWRTRGTPISRDDLHTLNQLIEIQHNTLWLHQPAETQATSTSGETQYTLVQSFGLYTYNTINPIDQSTTQTEFARNKM